MFICILSVGVFVIKFAGIGVNLIYLLSLHLIKRIDKIMSCILHIETSTEACSVAVSEDGWNEFKVSDMQGPQHAVQLGVFVDEALSFVDSHGMVLDAVAVSCGS